MSALGRDIGLELVVNGRAEVGEGPVWDVARGVLWWVDIVPGLIHRYDPRTARDVVFAAGSAVGAVMPRHDGRLVAALEDRLAVLDPATGALQTLLAITATDPPLRSNDAKCDPAGRLWLDRMAPDAAPGRGSLWSVSPTLESRQWLDGLTIPNGLAWSPDGRTMYYTDSVWCEVRAYAFEPATGEMGAARTLVSFPDDGTVPDGLTVDAEGCVWVARWGAGCVVRVSPGGEILGRVDLPVSQVTCCTFGGDGLEDLYITTAHEEFGPADFAREPTAGGLFRCRPGARGLPPAAFAG